MANFQFSEVMDPIHPQRKDEFRDALDPLPVGKAVIVTGLEQSFVSAKVGYAGKSFTPARKFRTSKLPDGRIQVTRTI